VTLNNRLISFFVGITFLTHSLTAVVYPVYFGTGGEGGILRASFDSETGSLSPIDQAAETRGAGFIAIHPNGLFLYSTKQERGERIGSVASWSIEEDGSLTSLNEESSQGRYPCHVSIDRTGSTVFVANYGSEQSVAALPVEGDGKLEQAVSSHLHEGSGSHPRRQKSPHPHSAIPNPANTFVYVADLGADEIFIYRFDSSTSLLVPAGSAEVPGGGKGPRHMVFSPDGAYLYVLNELSLDISIFTADPQTGDLDFVSTSPLAEPEDDTSRMSASEIRNHPNGRFLYAALRDLDDRGRDAIVLFEREPSTGAISRKETFPAQVMIPRNFNLSPEGKWMLVGGARSSDLAIFKVDPRTGALLPDPEIVEAPSGPICIEFLSVGNSSP